MTLDRKAIASFALGLISLVYFPLLTGFFAIIIGHLSRSSIKRSQEPIKGKTIALIGLVLGYLTLGSVVLVSWQRAHIAQNESSALASLRSVHHGVESHLEANQGSYPIVFSQLEKSGVDSMVVAGRKDGYGFTYEPIEKDGATIDYWVQAKPLQPGVSGRRTFCLEKNGNIHAAQPGEQCNSKRPLI